MKFVFCRIPALNILILCSTHERYANIHMHSIFLLRNCVFIFATKAIITFPTLFDYDLYMTYYFVSIIINEMTNDLKKKQKQQENRKSPTAGQNETATNGHVRENQTARKKRTQITYKKI